MYYNRRISTSVQSKVEKRGRHYCLYDLLYKKDTQSSDGL